jgi:hypothetical protein
MRTLASAFAGLALLAGVASVPAVAANVQSSQPPYRPQTTVTFTAGQGGGMTMVLPAVDEPRAIVAPTQTVAVTAGQAGNISIQVPGPSVDMVAKSPAAKPGPQVTLLSTEGIN